MQENARVGSCFSHDLRIIIIIIIIIITTTNININTSLKRGLEKEQFIREKVNRARDPA